MLLRRPSSCSVAEQSPHSAVLATSKLKPSTAATSTLSARKMSLHMNNIGVKKTSSDKAQLQLSFCHVTKVGSLICHAKAEIRSYEK